MAEAVSVIFGTALINNLVLVHLIGASIAYAGSASFNQSIFVGFYSALILVVAGIAFYLAQSLLITPYGLSLLELPVMATIVGVATTLLYLVSRNKWWHLTEHHQIVLWLAGGNSAVLGSILLTNQISTGFVSTLFSLIGSGLGLLVVLLALAAIREKLNLSRVPAPFQCRWLLRNS